MEIKRTREERQTNVTQSSRIWDKFSKLSSVPKGVSLELLCHSLLASPQGSTKIVPGKEMGHSGLVCREASRPAPARVVQEIPPIGKERRGASANTASERVLHGGGTRTS